MNGETYHSKVEAAHVKGERILDELGFKSLDRKDDFNPACDATDLINNCLTTRFTLKVQLHLKDQQQQQQTFSLPV